MNGPFLPRPQRRCAPACWRWRPTAFGLRRRWPGGDAGPAAPSPSPRLRRPFAGGQPAADGRVHALGRQRGAGPR